MTNRRIPRRQISSGTISWLLRTALQLPRTWLVASIIFAFLSLFRVTWTQADGFSVTFGVSGMTVLFLAVIWLPAFLQIFAIVGGAIRTPAGELSSPGIEQLLPLVDPETKDEAFGALKVIFEGAEESAPLEQRLDVRQIHQKLNEEYASTLSPEHARRELNQLAQRFQELREAPSGTRRNFLMEAIAGATRALVSKAKLSDREIETHLQSEHQGQRVVGLSCLEVLREVEHFNGALEIIANPKSAFEQAYALRVVEKLLPYLTPNEKQRLRQVLQRQREFDVAKYQWIKPGSDRWTISDRILATLDATG
jgi:DNA-binding CsgD family transcriptional regulator